MAIVHHWFVSRGGGERVAECIASLFPQAEIFTLMETPQGLPESLAHRVVHTSFLQKIPFAPNFHRYMLPLYPKATERLNLRGFDLVISSDSSTVKGVLLDPEAIHICYCHSPMRYLWDSYEDYRRSMSLITRTLFSAVADRVRRWDVQASTRVTHFIANSRYVAGRIGRFYGRECTVIYPPIDLGRAALRTPIRAPRPYLAVGRLVPYKRTELMIEACRRLGRELRIIGTGPDLARLRSLAAGGNVTFFGDLANDALWREYSLCRALLFAADEDFGMVPLEAQASGRPVIAYGAGGSLETVHAATGPGRFPAPTGVYFDRQTVESMMEGILNFEALEAEGAFDPETIRRWAQGFSTDVFLRRMRGFILEHVPQAAEAMAPDLELEYAAGGS